jgi:hypothetical protein
MRRQLDKMMKENTMELMFKRTVSAIVLTALALIALRVDANVESNKLHKKIANTAQNSQKW